VEFDLIMLDIPAYHYKLEDDIWHLWNWTLPHSETKYTDCGIVIIEVKESRLSGVSGVDASTLCPKCFRMHGVVVQR